LSDLTLDALGWSAFEIEQLTADDANLHPARITSVHRRNVSALTASGPLTLVADPGVTTASFAVGDWVMCDLESAHLVRRLDRRSLLQRGAEYKSSQRQLIAANLDTLFIVTSCNADFNVARLERYLALAHDAEIAPAILLTKADQTDEAADYIAQAQALGDFPVLAINAKGADVADALAPWCGPGKTVALVGSSGVGKTTLANGLTGRVDETQDIREDDARGRHTTTKRSMHVLPTGGWLIDTPGMRGLAVADVTFGIDYDDDMDKAIGIIRSMAEADERVLKDPEPFVKVVNLGDSSVDIQARLWCEAANLWDLKFHLTKAVKEEFDRQGISIPFPHRTLVQKQAAE